MEPLTAVTHTGVLARAGGGAQGRGKAAGIGGDLQRSSGQPADAVFDARTDLYKIRVGRLADRAAGERLQTQLAGLGISTSFLVSEGAGVEGAGFRVTQAGKVEKVEGRWLAVRSGVKAASAWRDGATAATSWSISTIAAC
jgi:hypothetical protein